MSEESMGPEEVIIEEPSEDQPEALAEDQPAGQPEDIEPAQDMPASQPEGVEPAQDMPAGMDPSIAKLMRPYQTEQTPEPTTEAVGEDMQDQKQQELIEELDELIDRMRDIAPEYVPPPYSPQGLVNLLRRGMSRFSPSELNLLERLRSGPAKDFLDPDTWKGVWFMLNYTVDYQRERINRRRSGEYETDEWGYDPDVVEAVRPFFDFLYKRYWRVEVTGMENVPEAGRALLVSNHSGQLPFDGSMVGMAVMNEHPNARLVRSLYAHWFSTVPFVSSLFVKVGQTLANEENAVRLLEQEQLVAVYPEGVKGVGKLYKDRYRLARFGRGGFIRTALRTGAPLIPVAVVGAEETYISLAKSDFIARLIGFPFFPISVTFPWLGLLGFVPFPTKWYIDFGEPIDTTVYGDDAADNQMLVSQLTDQVRNTVQDMIYTRLALRKSVLFG